MRLKKITKNEVDWLIDYLRFYVSLKNFSLIWRRHRYRWRTAKFRPMLGAQGLWAGRDLYRFTPAVTRDLGISVLIRRTAPFSRLLRHTRGHGGSILTWILTGFKNEDKQPICKPSVFPEKISAVHGRYQPITIITFLKLISMKIIDSFSRYITWAIIKHRRFAIRKWE
jgi:hypothetical protein